MILSTHAVVGGAVASLFPSHPVLVAVAAFASHFAIDAIPHWDYPLQAITLKPGGDNRRLFQDPRLFLDLALIGFDASAGLLLAIWLFAAPATIGVIVLGALAGMAPDPLQLLHSLFPKQPLSTLQSFHRWIHTKRSLTWPLGISSQALFATVVSWLILTVG
ncbi:hypothetical protein BST63_08475 [Bradyrhizobium canariense]|uniref:DUF3307 domain-containing protein n=2 Tax=Bradyrhizobium canariense TaxID=255045 RepID=A0ABX3X890_9BRAD|nr:hypothetical protein BSR47_09830 [Bradyrhizobium canariense]OSJ31943.1 hypothetical protein BST63_08475 [Bradyrhizobium canariense]